MAFAQFGATPEGGVDRPALSPVEIGARAELVRWARALGLEAYTDKLANLFLRLPGAEPDLPPLLIGSHIDSQPTGGRFDGVYGVLSAFEVVEAIRRSGVRPRRSIEIVAWTNEEGSRFAAGMMGSAGYAGLRDIADIYALTDQQGITAGEAIHSVLAADDGIPLRPLGRQPAAYIEPHIEQGPVLEEAGVPVGVVSGIQGKRTFRVVLEGEENHAGTSPRSVRRDALVAAVAIIGAMQKAIWDEADVARFTIGRFNVSPNAPSVVPSRVEFSIDLRHPDAGALQRLGDLIAPVAAANAGSCTAAVTQLLHDAPISFASEMRSVLHQAAKNADVPAMEIASGAGHDARHMSGLCPTGMIFIPCLRGISHHPAESIEPAHAEAGARVLAGAVELFTD